MKRRIQFLVLMLIAIGVLSVGLVAADNNSEYQSKIATSVADAAASGEAEFIISMADQADVSAAYQLPTKEAKGEFVYNTLRQHAEANQASVIAVLEARGAPYQSFFITNMILTRGDAALIDQLAQMSAVRAINANPSAGISTLPAEKSNFAPSATAAIEWNISKVKAPQAWALGYDGTGAVIAGQDTGYDWDHEALVDHYRGWDGSTADHNYNWHDSIHALIGGGANPCGLDSPVPCDDNDHGTHTMGTMVGDDGVGNQIGMAPGAEWISCRNMERGNGTPATYIECFEWFLAPTDLTDSSPDTAKAPHVINNSWGCPISEGCNAGNFADMETAVENLRAAGVVVVVSAGNSGSSCSTVQDPAAFFEGSFSVGSTTSTDAISSFSSRGPSTFDNSLIKPNISAPGSNVSSANNGGGYTGGWNGTSMAGPHVAGLVALIIDANPGLAGQVETIEGIIEQTTVQLTSTQTCGGVPGSSIPNNTFGYGRIDALAAVQLALNTNTAVEMQTVAVTAAPALQSTMWAVAAILVGLVSVGFVASRRMEG